MNRKRLLGVLLGLGILVEVAVFGARDNVCTRRRIGDHLCPELFFIGVQKAGSSALWVFLAFHRTLDIRMAEGITEPKWRRKEPHFFDVEFGRGLEWYSGGYGVRNTSEDLGIDATPDYAAASYVPPRMLNTVDPERVRFIISFRDPAARAYSWYKHIHAQFLAEELHGRAFKDFDYSYSLMVKYIPAIIVDCMNQQDGPLQLLKQCMTRNAEFYKDAKVNIEENKIVARHITGLQQIFSHGIYAPMLLHWFKYFPPESFCVVMYEQLADDFKSEVQHIAPCLAAFGRTLEVDPDEELKEVNSQPCENCENLERLSLDDKTYIGNKLHTELYLDSSRMLRRLVLHLYGRDDLPVWEDFYHT
ncbi:hypothetical protein NDN08_000740 [Rhodosorus marinus]|uniref:Sulfotransferase domain-containing protein n=1 Tax=Rhodosorus marinus TaxID=101924 RepID=A0AAV8UNV4_9RHOD|nr:hypothetical protein NDN08_000740 [Rhodosorus marinus]